MGRRQSVVRHAATARSFQRSAIGMRNAAQMISTPGKSDWGVCLMSMCGWVSRLRLHDLEPKSEGLRGWRWQDLLCREAIS